MNKYSFVWKKSTTKYEQRNERNPDEAMQTISSKHGIVCAEARELETALLSERKEPFVHGRGHRRTELRRDIEHLQELLSKREKYDGCQKTFNGRNSFSKTDPDATFMRMKEGAAAK